MTPERFTEIVNERVRQNHQILIPKGKEYSRNGDRLHNFKVAGRVKNESPERALWGMYVKHLVSIMDIIDDIEEGILPSIKVLDEKFTDSHNYHYLLEGLVQERIDDQTRPSE